MPMQSSNPSLLQLLQPSGLLIKPASASMLFTSVLPSSRRLLSALDRPPLRSMLQACSSIRAYSVAGDHHHHHHPQQHRQPPPSVGGTRAGGTSASELTARIAGSKSIKASAGAVLSESTRHHSDDEIAPDGKMAWMPIIGESVFRFDESDTAGQKTSPSLSFENPQLRDAQVDTSRFERKTPLFLPEIEVDGEQQTVVFKLPVGTTFYGTGEAGGPVERTGKRIYTWNTDAWGYNQNTTSLYQSHPWVFSVLPSGESFGMLADTSLRCEVDLRKERIVRFVAGAPFPVITFGPYPNPEALTVALARAIGTIQMPPKWALGYHQCRWSYEPAAKVYEIASTFREKNIPCDVVWMDIDYMQGFKCFTFDQEMFRDPKALSNELHDIGFKGIWMLNPGIKLEKGYDVYDTGSELDVWIQTPEGKPFVGDCWPGATVFPDFTNKRTRAWWTDLVKKFVVNGVDGIWNDMNEPAVFKTVTKTMPDDNVHRGDEELGGVRSHKYYHNAYGNFQAKATFDGMLLANTHRRPFVLTRAGFIGGQRFGATWTGDNLATWEHLGMSIPMAINLGLSGQPFAGPDIGGFAGDATPKLFVRWMGIGAMMPFARGHSEKGTIDQEPWSFGPEVEELCRAALNRRYRLLPHFYTLFYQAHKKGVPVMTPLFFADPSDSSLRKRDDGFLVGPILVSACPTPKTVKENFETALPKGIWHRFHFHDDNPELPLLFLKGGAIVPTGPVLQHAGEAKLTDTVTLLVALDDEGKAEGVLYEDEADGFNFKNGNYLLTTYEAQRLPSEIGSDGAEIVVRVARSDGNWTRPDRRLRVRLLLGDATEVEGESKDGEEVRVRVPTAAQVVELVASNHKHELAERGRRQVFLDEVFQEHEAVKGAGVVLEPIDLEAGNLTLKVVPWIGGRIISIRHQPSGYEWLEGRFEAACYEEYSTSEWRSPGCTEEYKVVRHALASLDGQELLALEGDIGGGLVMKRDILVGGNSPDKLNITSRIEARSVGAGSGGFSRLVRLRIRPLMRLDHPLQAIVRYTAVDGRKRELTGAMGFGETILEGKARPNGEWTLIDTETDLAVTNRFDLNQVELCVLSWCPASCTIELWSQERPVSKDTPIEISHEYEFLNNYTT